MKNPIERSGGVPNRSVDKVRMVLLLVTAILVWGSVACAQIAIDGRYWQYNGERVLLLGGWNHGHNPFIDHDTDDDRDSRGVSTPEQIAGAMDELAEVGGNTLRCVLDPGMAAGVQGMDFCVKTDAGYDLNMMSGPFWTRLDTFLSEAEKRDIIVQIEIWDRFDLFDAAPWEAWTVSPWNPKNNVNYTTDSSGLGIAQANTGSLPFLEGIPGHPVYERAAAERRRQYDVVRGYQEKFMDKLLSVTLQYDNVLYCMNNETDADPAWGSYWIGFIRDTARAQGKHALATDMFNNVFNPETSRGLKYQFENPGTYDYIDASQINSRHRDEGHWEKVRWILEAAAKVDPPYLVHMTKIYGNDIALNNDPWGGYAPGDTDNAIEEWWRNLLAGVAGVRFHRPTSGIGLSPLAKACISATRKVESKVRFWDVTPRLDLLSDRESDEAYLGADPGKAYILYFTKNGGGSVGLNLQDHPSTTFALRWVNIDTGEWGSESTLAGGGTPTIRRPDNSAHWVAAIVKQDI